MGPFTVERVRSADPNAVALRVMGRTARATADSFTVREWMARIAKTAGPKDYREQLRRVFAELCKRWRYIMETGEWVHGTPRSLLAHVLGARYNRSKSCPTPERCSVAETPAAEWSPGWGDCDDIATLAAACVLGLGLRPVFRVSRGPAGAHVAVTAVLPDGATLELDPVVYPEQGFNWAPHGPTTTVEHYDLDGVRIDSMSGQYRQPWAPPHFAPPAVPPGMGMLPPPGMHTYSGYAGYACAERVPETYIGEIQFGDFGAVQPYQHKTRLHVAAVHPNDRRGARVLAVPGWHARLMRRGLVWDKTPAVDQFGQWWSYSGDRDVWLPRNGRVDMLEQQRTAGMGGHAPGWPPTASEQWSRGYMGKPTPAQKQAKKAKRKARRRRTFEKVKRGFQKVGQAVRKVGAAILNSKFVQTIVAGVLQVFGVPMVVTKKLMSIAGTFIGKGGIFKLLKIAKKNPKEALKFLATAVKGAGQGALLKSFNIPGLSGFAGYGYHDAPEPSLYRVYQDGGSFYGAPVEGIVGLPGVYEFGQAMQVDPVGQPGRWYRVKQSDSSFLNLIKRVYGNENVRENARMVIAAAANAPYRRPSTDGFEKNYFGPDMIVMTRQFAESYDDIKQGIGPGAGETRYHALLWFPAAPGDEPPADIPVPAGGDDTEIPDIDVEPDGTPVPDVPVPEPVSPDEPREPEDMPPLGPVPSPFPDEPSGPVAPTDEEPESNVYPLKPIPWDDYQPPEQPAGDTEGSAPAIAAAGLLTLLMFL